MASHTLLEPQDHPSQATLELHRAILSLREELEAIDSYQQRADAAADPQLKEVFLHNRGEEIEHASMLLEWIRRHDGQFDRMLGTYLFTAARITSIEEVETTAGAVQRPGPLQEH